MPKKIIRFIKTVIDVCLYILSLLLMGQHLLAGAAHEWLGVAIFILFIAHTALNYRFYMTLFKGKYPPVRIVQTIVDLLLLMAMILCIVSSMMISGTVFKWMNLSGAGVGREIHLVSTAWTFILMSCHLGLHWSSFVALGKRIKINQTAKTVLVWILRVIVLALVAFGIYVFIARCFYEEMFLLTTFKFFDYNKSIIVYCAETFALSSVFIATFYYFKRIVITPRKDSIPLSSNK